MKILLSSSIVCLTITACGTHPAPARLKDAPNASQADLTIEAPFQQLIYTRKENVFDVEKLAFKPELLPVRVTYQGDTFEAQMRLRGGIRFCNGFPQLKLKLPKAKKIEGQTDFKIITHGTYAQDPNIPLDIPACANSRDDVDHRAAYALENQIYDLSARVLPYHLTNLKFMVRYLDPDHGIDLTEKAYFIEDADHAAKRYQMKEKEIYDVHSRLAWRGNDTDDLIEGLAGEEYLQQLAVAYRKLEAEHPELSPFAITEQIKPSQDELIVLAETLKAKAKTEVETFLVSSKEAQMNLLKQFNRPALAQSVLFRLMLRDTDWNLFGLTKHGTGIKNFELLSDGKEIFAVPYDFNESSFNMSGSIFTRENYLFTLKNFIKDMQDNLDGFLIADLEREIPLFAAKLRSVRDEGSLRNEARQSLDHFVEALESYGK